MKCEIAKLDQLSGSKTTIYSVLIIGENKTLFDIFIEENKGNFEKEINDISKRLLVIANTTGARDHFFK